MLVRGAAVALAALAIVALALAGRADAFVYWTENGLQSIGWANLGGSEADDTVLFTDHPQGVAVDSAHLYWVSRQAIGRADLNGFHLDQAFISGVLGAQGLAVDSAHIYWTTAGPTRSGAPTSTAPASTRAFIRTAVPAAGVAVDSAHVYWTNGGTNAIGRANLDGRGVNQTFITGAANPKGVAVDSAHDYWANGSSGTIGRADIGGSGATSPSCRPATHWGWRSTAPTSGGRTAPPSLPSGKPTSTARSSTSDSSPRLQAPRRWRSMPSPWGARGPGRARRGSLGWVADINQGGLPPGAERSLLAMLGAAERKLDAGNRQAACGSLGAFGNEIRALSGRTLDSAWAPS